MINKENFFILETPQPTVNAAPLELTAKRQKFHHSYSRLEDSSVYHPPLPCLFPSKRPSLKRSIKTHVSGFILVTPKELLEESMEIDSPPSDQLIKKRCRGIFETIEDPFAPSPSSVMETTMGFRPIQDDEENTGEETTRVIPFRPRSPVHQALFMEAFMG